MISSYSNILQNHVAITNLLTINIPDINSSQLCNHCNEKCLTSSVKVIPIYAMKPYRRGCTVPLTLLTSILDKSEWSASHPSCFMPRETAPVSTEEETGWAPEHFQEEKCPVPDRLQSPHHSDCSRVTTLTTPPWLQTYSNMISKTQSKNNTWCRILSWWRTVKPCNTQPPSPNLLTTNQLANFPTCSQLTPEASSGYKC
jgi:hypothetical protein